MPKQMEHSDDARAALKRGIDLMAETVGVTLGPRGRNVVIDDDFAGPKVSSDGVTIAKEIVLEDAYENMGAQLLKEAASKTNDNAGDGTGRRRRCWRRRSFTRGSGTSRRARTRCS